ncbi:MULTISPECIES: hypothetical protein [Fluviispira]|uniref:Uncharacterized protein n=1 Tax=Fluviispira sanaruensis TaxID=2493639 RepID=A0A4P2VPZ8_FLUSA|nr:MULTISPECIES: hypothetical protein [Fluviispira]BBH54380.1 hypothetical protein JCM31447_28440 [Fluviispira sanaruensis]
MKIIFNKIILFTYASIFLIEFSANADDLDIKKILMSNSMNELVILANINKSILEMKYTDDLKNKLNRDLYDKIIEQNEILKEISITLLRLERLKREIKTSNIK